MSNANARSSSPLLPVLVVALVGGLAYWLWSRDAGGDPEGAGEAGGGARGREGGGAGGVSGEGLRAKRLLSGRDELLVAAKAALRGAVRDPEGAPIAGAQVCASPSSSSLLRSETREPSCATTEADGTYRIDDLFPVEHSVNASAPTYIPARYSEGEGRRKRRSVRLLAGVERANIDLVLKPGGVEIGGVVRDLSGGVLEGALVTAGGGAARSGEDGRFALWVEPGTTYVRASADGYAANGERGAAPGHAFEVFLTPESVLLGKVVDAGTGAPLAGVSVTSDRWGARFSWGGRGPEAVTDAGGNFRIDGLEPGTYKPTAFDDEHYGVAAAQVSLGLGQTSEPVTVEVHPAMTVAGTIVPEDGEACERGSVSLTDETSKRSFAASTEGDGAVLLRGVLPGTYDVDVDCDGYVPEERYEPLTVEAAVSGLEWSVASGQAILGQVVTAKGDAAPAMRVRATMKVDAADPRARQTSSWGVETEEDGSFAIYGLKPATYELGISGERPGPDAPVEVEVPKGRDVEGLKVELPGSGSVTGRVVDERGAPVADVTVNLRSKDRGGGMSFFNGRSSSSARTADDGEFTIEHVRPGSYRAEAAQGWTRTLRSPGTSDDDVQGVELSVSEDEATQIELRVEAKGAQIRGKVVDADGGPVDDAFISATRESDSATKSAGSNVRASRWGNWDLKPVLTDTDGSFTIDNLTVGTYTVHARRKGGGEGFTEGVATDGEAVITIESTGSLGGTVTAAAGPPEEFTVTLRDRESAAWRTDTFFRTGGAFSFDGLTAGTYEITVEAGEGSAKGEETLADGEERDDVRIELVGRVTVRGRLVDLDSGEPIAGMSVSVGPSSGGMFFGGGGGGGERKQVSDANGEFEVVSAPTGEVLVSVSPQSWGGTSDYSWTSLARTLPAAPATQDIGEITLVKKRLTDQEKSGDLGFKLRDAAPDEEWTKRELKIGFVRPGGPAAAAGLKAGDVITSVNGHDVTGEATYKYGALTRAKAGEAVTFGLASGSSVKVVLGPAI